MKRTPLKRKSGLKRSTKRLAKNRLTPIGTLKRNAWKAISAFVRKRDKMCVTCKVNPAVHCGHYRHNTERNADLGGNALWYDERNLHGQCAGCNTYKYGALDQYALYLTDKFGHEVLKEIDTLWRTPRKWTRQEIEDVASYYTALTKEI